MQQVIIMEYVSSWNSEREISGNMGGRDRMKQNGEIFSVKSSGILLCILVTTAKVIDVLTRRFIGNVVDKGIGSDFGVELFVCIAIICAITLLLQYLQPYSCAGYETKYTSGLFIKIINSFLLSKQCEIDEKNVGEVSTCFSSDVNGVFQFAKRKYTIFFPDAVSFIVCVFFLMKMQRSLGIITLCVGLVSGFCMTKISKSMFSKMNDYQNKLKDINKFTSDGLINVEMIKVNLLTEKLEEQYEQELMDLNNIKKKLAIRQAFLSAPSMILSFSTLMTVAFYGGYCVLSNSMSIGSLMSAIIMADYIVSPIMRLENTLVQYRRSLVNQANINKITEMNLEEEECNCISNSERFSFKNVSFSYPDNRMVFNDLNLNFTKGKINYIIGKNGVGKTTFIKLLNGVYETNKGEISLPFSESSLSKIRNRISVMSQESLLFADTIKDNIFKEGDSEDKFQELCRKLNLDSEIMSFGSGYETILQENGDPLSGGQKKRICFLRCVMNEADIYVFDEPTANVDRLNANVMMDYIFSLSKNHYVILITHDKDLLDKYPGYIQEISGA